MGKPPMVFDPASHTGAGRSKRRPPPRPAGDSLPRHTCEFAWCGNEATQQSPGFDCLELTDWRDLPATGRWFCSLGCLGRWAAIQEVRQ